MKRLISVILAVFVTVVAFAQSNVTVVKQRSTASFNDNYQREVAVPFVNSHLYKKQLVLAQQTGNNGAQRAISVDTLGTAGNLFTIINAETKSLCADDNLNTVVFVHRTNPFDALPFPNENVGMYRYDFSFDGGASWANDIGVLNPSASQDTLAGRYPQCAIYNPVGNLDTDSAYMVYLGPWLPFDNGGTWEGIFWGSSRLDNDSSNFTENWARPNDGEVLIPGGLCKGEPGVFWSVDFAATETGQTFDSYGILIYKGVWNNNTNDVDFALSDTLYPPFDKTVDGSSQAAGLTMGFDPTGQEGWIGFVGDIDVSINNANYFDLHFYHSTDAGATWNGPISLEIDDFDNIVSGLTQGLPATTGFEADMTVDVNGNPHYAVLVGSGGDGQDYSITTGGTNPGLKMYDFTRITDDTSLNCQWQAVYLDSVQTMRGDITSGTDGVSTDNRPQVARSSDGTKIFVSWLDSDPNLSGGTNDIPDFWTRGIDVTTGLGTATVNWTKNTNWEASAIFGTMSREVLESGGIYTLPMVFAQVNSSGESGDPASFYYMNGIEYSNSDFTDPIFTGLIPEITVIGDNPAYVYLGDSYNDAGATAVDCIDGDLTDSIQVSSTVNTTMRGIYQVTYTVENISGFTGTATRDVIVNTEPDAEFTFAIDDNIKAIVTFLDQSLYSPTDWSWDFGDFFLAPQQNPTHTYTANGIYNVCLDVRNVFNGAPWNMAVSSTCKDVELTQVGIQEAIINQAISVYPNPTEGVATISISGLNLTNVTISVHNIVGKEVAMFEMKTFSASNNISLDLSNYNTGVYLIKVQSDEGVTTKHLSVY